MTAEGIDKGRSRASETAGHYGLRGMTERAALIGETLTVWSEVGEGTELELRLPANIAYDTIQNAPGDCGCSKEQAGAEGDTT